jgi:hypothetical protein
MGLCLPRNLYISYCHLTRTPTESLGLPLTTTNGGWANLVRPLQSPTPTTRDDEEAGPTMAKDVAFSCRQSTWIQQLIGPNRQH